MTASWEIDIFSRLRNGKLRNKALYYQSIEYRQAVRTQLIATTANLYFTLCMLDEQYAIANETAAAWREMIDAIRAMKEAGMATEAAVAQNEAAYYSVETSVKQLAQSISETENSLCSLLAQTPHKIERGSLESQQMPVDLLIGVPVQLLSRRPDVRRAEYSLMSAYYATAEARSALYPQITLSGTAGWTNSAGSQIVNPRQAASVGRRTIVAADLPGRRQPCAREDRQSAAAGGDARLRADDSQCRTRGQRCADRLPDGTRVGALYDQQVASLRRAVESTELLMQHGSTTYLEVLTARQSLLSAQLQQVANRFTELQSVVTLYHAPRRRTRNGSGAVAFFLRPIFTTGKSEQGFPVFSYPASAGTTKIFRFSHRPLDYHLQFRIFVRSVTKTKRKKIRKTKETQFKFITINPLTT